MRIQVLCVMCGLASCRSNPQIASSTEPGSWTEHMQAAQQHDQQAAEHEEIAAHNEAIAGNWSYNCGDQVLNDTLTSGPYHLMTWQPCFDVSEEAAEHYRFLADRERKAARQERVAAADLVRQQEIACAGIPPQEREHSFFAHHREISDVIPHRVAGKVRGVWIVFKPVAGMNADWVRRDIACQRARWAVKGETPDNAAGSPALVAGADTQVFDRDGHVEVLVTTEDEESAQVALARATSALPGGQPPAQTAQRER
jgi:hypothetical protein